MATKSRAMLILGVLLATAGSLWAQQKADDIPDAPSATRPIPPPEPPSNRPGANVDETPDAPPANDPGANAPAGSGEMPRSTPDSTDQKPAPPTMPPITTVPTGSVPRDFESQQDVNYTIRATTNLVLVPVMVKDAEGRLVGGAGF